MAKQTSTPPPTITKDELEKLNAFSSNRGTLVQQLGNISVAKKNLKTQKEGIFKSMERLELLQDEFQKELLKKYGNKIIDPATGIISDPID